MTVKDLLVQSGFVHASIHVKLGWLRLVFLLKPVLHGFVGMDRIASFSLGCHDFMGENCMMEKTMGSIPY